MSESVLELCAGGGGQALGLEQAGFDTAAVAELDEYGCATLRLNRPQWQVLETDIRDLNGRPYGGIDLVAGGVPCPPFSVAGKRLGREDERDLFPEALRLVREAAPRAVLLENVQGFSTARFAEYREWIRSELETLGYRFSCRILNASHFGVPQLRPRFLMVALRPEEADYFRWPRESADRITVGEAIVDLMTANGWPGALAWSGRANKIAPTIVGGSKKHGGPDLGPTRAKRQWAALGVDGMGVANEAPDRDFPPDGSPRLTTRMVARLQGFPDDWRFSGRKTAAYRQVGNAFPPPVARAVGGAILAALRKDVVPTYHQDPDGQMAFIEENARPG